MKGVERRPAHPRLQKSRIAPYISRGQAARPFSFCPSPGNLVQKDQRSGGGHGGPATDCNRSPVTYSHRRARRNSNRRRGRRRIEQDPLKEALTIVRQIFPSACWNRCCRAAGGQGASASPRTSLIRSGSDGFAKRARFVAVLHAVQDSTSARGHSPRFRISTAAIGFLFELARIAAVGEVFVTSVAVPERVVSLASSRPGLLGPFRSQDHEAPVSRPSRLRAVLLHMRHLVREDRSDTVLVFARRNIPRLTRINPRRGEGVHLSESTI